MSEPSTADDDGSAGALLRAARNKQGLHIAMLAAAIKVPQAKLEALEAGRFEALPDLTFARALALSLCRVLKIDPAPVLARLPGAPAAPLDKVDGGLNMPFRERPGRIDPSEWSLSRQAIALIVALLLMASVALWWQPVKAPSGLEPALPASAAALSAAPASAADETPPASAAGVPSAAGAASAATAAQTTLPPPLAPAVGGASVPATAAPAAPPRGDGLGLRASQNSWVQVSDGQGRVLLSRQLGAGEAVDIAGEPPYKLRIGNVRGLEVRFRGALVDLEPVARANTATLTLP